MNSQSNKPKKTNDLERLFQLWNLTPANGVLARTYLTDDRADDSLLSGAERQIFALLYSDEGHEVNELLNKLAPPDQEEIQAKVLKLLWAIGGSTAGFAAQPGQQIYNTDNEKSDELFRFRSRILGIPAAAAMDAEEIAAYPRGVDQTQRLRRLAATNPDALVEAQRLISDTWNSVPGGGQRCCSDNCGMTDELWESMSIGVLAMVLLTAVKQDRSEKSLYKEQEEVVLNRVEAILDHYDETALSEQDASLLKAYIQVGDPTAPFPETSRPTAWQREPLDIFTGNYLLYKMAAKYAVMCTAPAVLFGLGDDPRLSCALRVLTGIEIETTLEAILLFLPEDRDVDALDSLIPHIPGGKVTLLRFLVMDGQNYRELGQKVAERYRAGGEEAANLLNIEEYERLGRLLPDLKHSKDEAWINALHERIVPCMLNIFDKSSQKEIIRDYLEGKEAFVNSAAFLKPIHNENRWIFNVDEGILEYRKLAGWDEFACRCMIVLCLTCTGNGISKSLLNNKDEKQTIDAFVKALPALGLPVRDCMTVLATMCDQIYDEKGKKLLIKAVRKHFVTEPGLAGLADAARNSSSSARIMVVEGLETLASTLECTEEARRALTACAGDSSKQVQELLMQIYLSHPDWDQDYLAMLSGKKAAQRILAAKVLAGLDAEKYRPALKKALSAEKNAKVMEQITALLVNARQEQ